LKYTRIVKNKKGKRYVFVPPKDAVLAGVVRSKTFSDGRTARVEIPKLIDLVERFRRGEIVIANLGPKSTLGQVKTYYLNTKHFNSLSYNTQKNYEYSLNTICDTEVHGTSLSNTSIRDLSIPLCTKLYDTWEDEVSTERANQLSRVFSVLMNYCLSLDLLQSNPMSHVKKRKHEPRSVVWEHDQVMLFLDTAFTEFKWRNIGLIVLMCYEWGQRPVDVRLLTWDSVDLEQRRVHIKQTKRGAEVELPIPTNLFTMLSEQQDDWGFQEYVVPYHRASDGAYRPLSEGQVSLLANEVKEACGLPCELQVGDLRKTAIMQMVDGEVDHLAIMSVTGHKNIASLNPYNKHNYKTAKSALERRSR
jgi:integrase